MGFFLVLEFKHCLYCRFKDNVAHTLPKPGKDLDLKFSSGRDGKGTAAVLWGCVNCRE